MKQYIVFITSIIILLTQAASAQTRITNSVQKQGKTIPKMASDASSVYAKNSPSVVVIEATDKSGSSQGSGVAFRNGGKRNASGSNSMASTWIVTNAHVPESVN
jgi:hypothetical protein